MSIVISPQFQFFSVTEAAEQLGLTDGRVRQLLRSKEPPRLSGHKVGQRAWAIPPTEIERFRKERETATDSGNS
jgi:excisionase family DNA binding protein